MRIFFCFYFEFSVQTEPKFGSRSLYHSFLFKLSFQLIGTYSALLVVSGFYSLGFGVAPTREILGLIYLPHPAYFLLEPDSRTSFGESTMMRKN